MKDKLTGIDALNMLPLSDVLLPYDTALQHLTGKTVIAINENARYLAEIAKEDGDSIFAENIVTYAREFEKNPDPGGYSFSPEELQSIYEQSNTSAFVHLADYIFKDVIPSFYNRRGMLRNKGAVGIGYILDTVNLVDTGVATYDEKVEVMTRAMRRQEFSPLLLGSMMDDVIHLKGTAQMPFEVIINRDEASSFAEQYLKIATDEERELYQLGYSITLEEIWGHLGISLN